MQCIVCEREGTTVCPSCGNWFCDTCESFHECKPLSNPNRVIEEEKNQKETIENLEGEAESGGVIRIDSNTYLVKCKDVITGEEVVETIFVNPHEYQRREKNEPEMLYAEKIADIYDKITLFFRFPNEETAKVFLASWLIRDGNVFLRGVPGTGKTTLIEISTYCLANPVDYSKINKKRKGDDPTTGIIRPLGEKTYSDGETDFDDITGYNPDAIDRYLKSDFGTLGIVKHNPDKLPTEVLYKTDIVLEKTIITDDGIIPAGNPVSFTRRNPPDGRVTYWATNPSTGKKVSWQKYDFKPEARVIVKAPIKLHNECFVPGSFVFSNPGVMKIEDIDVGNKVMGNGNFVNVTHKFKNHYNGDIVKIKPFYSTEFSVTPNHPLKVANVERKTKSGFGIVKNIKNVDWKDANYVTKDDFLAIPKYNVEIVPQTIDMSNYISNPKYWEISDDQIKVINKNNSHSRFVEMDEDVFRFLGWYVAEGSPLESALQFSINTKDLEKVKPLSEKIDKIFGTTSKFYSYHKNIVTWRVDLTPLRNFVVEECGHGAMNKKIPMFVLNAPKNLLKAFLESYLDGDGHINENYSRGNYTTSMIVANTVSPKLAYGLQVAFTKLGILGSVNKHKNSCDNDEYRFSIYHKKFVEMFTGNKISGKRNRSWNKFIETDDCFYVPIQKIEREEYDGDVYNIETSDHTYVAPVLVHNCNRMSLSVADAILGLMAEKQVEYLGEVFNSPQVGRGCVTFLDSNPHLDDMGYELDPAFRDRVDVGIWFPSPSLFNRVALSKMQNELGKDLRSIFFQLLNRSYDDKYGGLEPLSYNHLREVWDDVESIEIPESIEYRISLYTWLFGCTLKVYDSKHYHGEVKLSDFAAEFAEMKTEDEKKEFEKKLRNWHFWQPIGEKFVDKSLVAYSRALNKMPMASPDVEVGGEPETMDYLDDVIMPLGDRSRQSLTKLLKAYCWVEKCLTMTRRDDEGNLVNPDAAKEPIIPREEDVFTLLPYVVDHRVGLSGIGGQRGSPPNCLTYKSFLSYFDFVKYHLIPEGIGSPENDKQIKGLIELIRKIDEITSVDSNIMGDCLEIYLKGGILAKCSKCGKVIRVDSLDAKGKPVKINKCPDDGGKIVDEETFTGAYEICGGDEKKYERMKQKKPWLTALEDVLLNLVLSV